MSDLTDEEAISYAETFVNHFKAARRLEDLIRYIKNARKDFPELQQRLADLNTQISEASAKAASAESQYAQIKAEFDPKIADMSARHKASMSAVTAIERNLDSLRSQAKSFAAANREYQAKLDTLTAAVSTLTEEEKVLRVKIADHETRLAELRQGAAKLLEA